jgi:hypothetical protein
MMLTMLDQGASLLRFITATITSKTSRMVLCAAADPAKLDVSFLQLLQRIKAAGSADVLLGCDAGAAPLPAASCMRLGLLDLVSNLQVLAAVQNLGGLAAVLNPSRAAAAAAAALEAGGVPGLHVGGNMHAAVDPDVGVSSVQPAEDCTHHAAFNAAACAVWPDAYYDLSAAHSSHLEVPFRTSAYSACAAPGQASHSSSSSTAAGSICAESVACFSSIAQGLLGLRHGVPFLCGIPAPAAGGGSNIGLSTSSTTTSSSSSSADSMIILEPSVHRGGSTFVLNHKALLIPQHAFSVRR